MDLSCEQRLRGIRTRFLRVTATGSWNSEIVSLLPGRRELEEEGWSASASFPARTHCLLGNTRVLMFMSDDEEKKRFIMFTEESKIKGRMRLQILSGDWKNGRKSPRDPRCDCCHALYWRHKDIGYHYYPPSPSGTLGTLGVVNYF